LIIVFSFSFKQSIVSNPRFLLALFDDESESDFDEFEFESDLDDSESDFDEFEFDLDDSLPI
jgi:hypothetical protein